MALTKQDLEKIGGIVRTEVKTEVFDAETRIKSEIRLLGSELEDIKEKIGRIWKAVDEDLWAEHKLILALQQRIKSFEKRLARLEVNR